MNIPKKIYAGTTIKWRDDSAVGPLNESITSGTGNWSLTYYLRTNTASEGHTVVGTSYGTGWEFTISATDSADFDAGDWYWQAIATKGAESLTLGYGNLTVEASLSYTGAGNLKFDGRTQAQKDLEAVQTAIRTLLAGGAVQEYRIGNRNLKRYDLADLIQLEGRLKAEVKREEQAELIANGLGNPRNMFVRFN